MKRRLEKGTTSGGEDTPGYHGINACEKVGGTTRTMLQHHRWHRPRNGCFVYRPGITIFTRLPSRSQCHGPTKPPLRANARRSQEEPWRMSVSGSHRPRGDNETSSQSRGPPSCFETILIAGRDITVEPTVENSSSFLFIEPRLMEEAARPFATSTPYRVTNVEHRCTSTRFCLCVGNR